MTGYMLLSGDAGEEEPVEDCMDRSSFGERL